MNTIDVRIDSIATGGDGVGRHEGLVVFTPRTAPGDLARVTGTQSGRLIRGRLVEVLEPSAGRVEPECAHYIVDRCGGCQIQHLSYDAQLAAKARIIGDALTRIGKIRIGEPTVVPSARQWRYRRKLTLALRRRDDGWIAGLRRYDDPDHVFPLQDCPITDETVVECWRSVMRNQALLPTDSAELRAAVRLLASGRFAFTLEGGRRWDRNAEFLAAVPEIGEIWWRPAGKSLRQLHGSQGDATGASFVQVNPSVAGELRSWVLETAFRWQPATAIDAYAGEGEVAAALAAKGTRVTAIEMDRSASRLSASRLPSGSRAVTARVEDALAAALPADVVIVNPPRAGLDARVPDALNRATPVPRAIIYVSCNPSTLARDVGRLGRFAVRNVRGFDMFPQTAHVETVCEMVPAA